MYVFGVKVMALHQGFGDIWCSHLQGRIVYPGGEADTYLLNLLYITGSCTSPQVFPCNVIA
jgi:hypothetical protein